MSARPFPSPHILMLVGDTIARARRTGIHRVVVEAARGLAGAASFDLVRWDWLEGRLRFLDMDETDQLFGAGDWPPGLTLRPQARRVGRPFREQLADDPQGSWLLVPEVGWHEADGIEAIARAMAHCRDWGGRTAAVFYDLIPIRNPVYAGGAENHEAYLTELVHADLIVPISRAAGDDLEALWRERRVEPHPPVRSLLLPDGGFGPAAGQPPSPPAAPEPARRIVLVGTVEPRKRQVEFLKAMEAARAGSPEVAKWSVSVLGGVHGFVAADFAALVKRNPWLTHVDYPRDEAIRRAVREADFTVFASDDEGYGLPIAESLAFGTPCLCADFGAMAEIAAGGGCLAIDVRDSAAMEAAIVRLCENPDLVQGLRAEIAARRFRSWADYGQDLVALLQAHDRGPLQAPVRALDAAAGTSLDAEAFARLAGADVVRFDDPADRAAFIAQARRQAWPALLPALPDAEAAEAAVRALAEQRRKRLDLAAIERAYAHARQAAPPRFKTRQAFLRILISTFNRREFVVANVLWILKAILGKDDDSVELVVVDGGSSDGTLEALDGVRDARLQVIESPTNVGMLAGLREAARLPGAEYIWLVGDDDLIQPKAFREILAALRANRGVPLGFTNFSVYYRDKLLPEDRAQHLIALSHPMAERTIPTGIVKVREAAEQTDNLFTAIYAIIWRADLLSAAYEHAFDGAPFADLTEAVPCAEFILGRYGECDALWHSAPGVSGNGHNSWSRHRPRWHGAIMPQALRLAREAGVDPVRLQTWADLHRQWLDEALESAAAQGADPRLGPADAPLAEAVFRGALPGAYAP